MQTDYIHLRPNLEWFSYFYQNYIFPAVAAPRGGGCSLFSPKGRALTPKNCPWGKTIKQIIIIIIIIRALCISGYSHHYYLWTLFQTAEFHWYKSPMFMFFTVNQQYKGILISIRNDLCPLKFKLWFCQVADQIEPGLNVSGLSPRLLLQTGPASGQLVPVTLSLLTMTDRRSKSFWSNLASFYFNQTHQI